MNRFLHALSIVLLITMPLYADYHYASHTGSSTYPYTSWETAADSIQAAVNVASAGDTIYVGSGVWDETNIRLHEYKALIGRGIDTTIFFRPDYYDTAFVICYTGSLVEGFTFDGHRRLGGGGVTGDAFDSLITIRNNKFTRFQCAAYGSFKGTWENNIFFDNTQSLNLALVRSFDSVIKNNTFDSAFFHLMIWSGSHVVTNNVFLRKYGSDDAVDINLFRGDTLLFANNILYKNGTPSPLASHSQIGGYLYRVENNVIIGVEKEPRDYGISGAVGRVPFMGTNNIITNCGRGWHSWHYSDTTHIRYSDFWDNAIDIYDPTNFVDSVGLLHFDPMFQGPFDFRLQAYSPLIDAGDPNIFDVDGTRSDIGCYGGPGGCSYVYLDLAPLIPDSLSAFVDSTGIHLTWRNNYEADFNRYQVFRDTISGFPPSVFNMIGEPDTSYFLDTNISPGVSYYYRFTSVDNQRNVSEHSTELAVYQTGMRWDEDGNLRPEYASIEKAYPNPFNSDVTIVYSASNLGPQPPEIRLLIYDIQGRVVRTLVDERKPSGTYRVVWDGKNDLGEPVSSGNYIVKLYQWGLGAGDFPVKITLLR